MRKTLLALLMLIMLTPSLACAMAFCPTQGDAMGQQPCHQSDDSAGPMLALDCLGVDLFQQDASNDILPDLSLSDVDYAWADLVSDSSIQSDRVNGIRGSPDEATQSQSRLSLILTTQRFRI